MNAIGGCYYYGTGTGCGDIGLSNQPPACADLTSQTVCEGAGAGCTWSECTGTAEPCEALDATDCASHAGCYATTTPAADAGTSPTSDAAGE
jgi:hypothetical protein